MSQGLDGVVLVHDSERPGQDTELEKFFKGFAQPHKLTVTQCLVLGMNLSGSYSLGRGINGPLTTLPAATLDVDPRNPEAALSAAKAALDKLFTKCLERNRERQKNEIEEDVLEDDAAEE